MATAVRAPRPVRCAYLPCFPPRMSHAPGRTPEDDDRPPARARIDGPVAHRSCGVSCGKPENSDYLRADHCGDRRAGKPVVAKAPCPRGRGGLRRPARHHNRLGRPALPPALRPERRRALVLVCLGGLAVEAVAALADRLAVV